MAVAQTIAPSVVKTRPKRASSAGPLVLLGVWILVASALGFAHSAFLEPFAVKIIELSVMLFAVGLILATIVSRPLTLHASLVQLKLGPWIAVGFAIVFGLSSLTWLKAPTDNYHSIINTDYLVPAGALALFGLLALLAGYRLCPRVLARTFDRVDTSIRGPEPVQPSLSSILVLWALSMLAALVQMATGSYGFLSNGLPVTTSSLTEVLALIAKLGLLATLLAGWRYGRSRSASSRLVLALVLVTQLALGLFGGFKQPFVVQFLAVFVGYGVSRRVRLVPVLTSVAVFIFVVFPFITLYRAAVSTGSGSLSPAGVLTNVSLGSVASSSANTPHSSAFDSFAYRLSRIGDVAAIMQKTPSAVPYRSPLELVEAPVLGIVPRSIWKQKPVFDFGSQMSQIYYEIPPSVPTSSAMTPYGDLWRHGGLAVVGIGMLLLGFLARVIDARHGDAIRDPRLLFLPMLLFVPLVKQETDYVSLVASLISVVVVAALAARLVTTLSSSAST